YFDSSAHPAPTPAPTHQPQPRVSSARTKQNAAASSAAISGPSGSTQLPVVTPSTGARFSAAAAHHPASRENSSAVSRYMNNVDSANSAMNGSRTTIAASLPVSFAIPADSHQASGG